MVRGRAIGRNDRCSCGSGKKFKHCCEKKQQGMDRQSKVLLIAVVGLVAGAVLIGITSLVGGGGSGPRQVWSAEHGHYHTID